MTLSQRNRLISFGIGVSILSFLILLISAKIIFPIFPDATGAASRRAISLIHPLLDLFFSPEPYAVFISIFLICLYALIAAILIYFFFEKTQCQEILFFTFFIISFCFEAFRFVVPLNESLELPRVYVIIAGRLMLFGRVFGILSLFASSVYAAGFQTQKQSTIIIITVIIAMIIAIGTPVDALSWDTALNIITGYSLMLLFAETGVFFFSIVSFFVGAYSRGSREFIHVGVGSILVFFGRNILLNCDTWVALPVAVALLGVGTWFVCSRLHRVYLWL